MNTKRKFTLTVKRLSRGLLTLIFVLALLWPVPGLLAGNTTLPGNFIPAAAASDPVIAAAGDIACDPATTAFNGGLGTSSSCRQEYTSNLLVNGGFAAILSLGDNQYYCGGYQAFVQSYDPSWGRVKAITHPVVGNHEYLTSGGTGCDPTNTGAAGYFQYFGAAAGTAGQGYYSFDVGAWHLIALNSNCTQAGGCGSTSAQYHWLQADLAAHPNQCTLAYWHIPLFSSGGRASPNSLPFWQLLYNAHADLVLNGHDHIYERFAPQDSTGTLDQANGIREFIVGTGGADHTSIASLAANSQVNNTSTYGILSLTLHTGSYDWQFVPEAGQTFTDAGTQNCHSNPANTPTFTPTPTSTATSTNTPTPTGSLVASDTPTATSTGTLVTDTPTLTSTVTDTPTLTSTVTDTSTFTPTVTDTLTFTPTVTDIPTFTPAVTDTPTLTPTVTDTPTFTPTVTDTPTFTPTVTYTPTFTPTVTNTSTLTPTFTYTPTLTPTVTYTPTLTPTFTYTPTLTPTVTYTPTFTPTVTYTPTLTPTPTFTLTSTLTFTPTATLASSSTTFTPVADTYVDASNTGTNYGSATSVRMDGSPDVHAYLRFSVSGLSGTITQVRLLLHSNNSDSSGIRAWAVANNTWGELTTNYTNAPALGSQLATSAAFASGVWVSLDVTSYVTGNGTYSIGVTNLSSTAISVASRESGANAPQLVITTSSSSIPTSTPTLTPTPTRTLAASNTPTLTPSRTLTPTITFTPTITRTATLTRTPTFTLTTTRTFTPTATSAGGSTTFTPVADTYVNSGSTGTNYGNTTSMYTDGSPDMHAYVRFTVSGLSGTITQVRLLLHSNNSDSVGIRAWAVANNTWGELTTNYSNAPALGSQLATSAAFASGVWVSLDITSYVTGNGTYSIGVTNLSSTAISVASRESGANAPQLVITYH